MLGLSQRLQSKSSAVSTWWSITQGFQFLHSIIFAKTKLDFGGIEITNRVREFLPETPVRSGYYPVHQGRMGVDDSYSRAVADPLSKRRFSPPAVSIVHAKVQYLEDYAPFGS
jgi:hypothetical protein